MKGEGWEPEDPGHRLMIPGPWKPAREYDALNPRHPRIIDMGLARIPAQRE